jgi:hypothetical protein
MPALSELDEHREKYQLSENVNLCINDDLVIMGRLVTYITMRKL